MVADPADRRFLILRYKHHGAGAGTGESTEVYILDNTLNASGLGKAETFYLDADYSGFPSGDWRLLEKCRQVKPAAILLSSYEPGHPGHPRVETLRFLRRHWNIPLVAIWFDTCWDGFWGSLEALMPLVDLHVVTDNPEMAFFPASATADERRRFKGLMCPYDFGTYRNHEMRRDISVSFMGQVGGYRSPRMLYIEHLMERNVPIYWSGFARSEQPPHRKYIEVLNRSKISLNFSHSVDRHQLKGRVFEVMLCGAMLMESDNPQTRRYLTPMRDYVTFDSEKDLVDKIAYYLGHDEDRLEIAAHGELMAKHHCDHYRFWSSVLGRLEQIITDVV